MAINTAGTTTSLPPGAVARLGGGLARTGYGYIQGSFPAGKYLVKSAAPCAVWMGQTFDERGFSSASRYGDCIISTTKPTNVLEYLALVNPFIPGTAEFGHASATNANAIISTGGGYQLPIAGKNLVPSRFVTSLSPYTTVSSIFFWRGTYFRFNSDSSVATYVYTSATGHRWTQGAELSAKLGLGTVANITNGVAASNGSVFVSLTTTGGTTSYFYTTNPLGSATGYITGTLPVTSSGLTYANGLFIAWGSIAGYATSTDGINWTSYSRPGGTATVSKIVGGNGVFIAHDGSAQQYWYSTDAINWTVYNEPSNAGTTTSGGFSDIAFGNGMFLTAGQDTSSSTTSPGTAPGWRSFDGINWTRNSSYLGKYTTATALADTITYVGGYFYLGSGHLTLDGMDYINVTLTGGYVPSTSFSNSTKFSLTHRGLARSAESGTNDGNLQLGQPNVVFDVYQLDSSYQIF